MPEPPTPARRPRLARALLAAGALVLGLALAEGGHRIWLAAHGRAHDAAVARAELERLASQAGELTPRAQADPDLPEHVPQNALQARFLHPFLGWEQRSSVRQWEEEVERDRSPRDPRDFDVIVVGGSVAEIFAGMGSGALMRELHADPRLAGRRLRVRGWARGGWKAPQPQFAVAWLLQRGVPMDAVVLIDGFNELALSCDNAALGIQPAYPSAMHWAALAAGGSLDREAVDHLTEARAAQRAVEAITSRALSLGFARSSLLTQWARGRASQELARSRAAFEAFGKHVVESARAEVLHGAPFDPDVDRVLRDAVRAWGEASRQLDAVCRAHGITYLHVLQPTLHDPGAKPATDEELEHGTMGDTWHVAVERGYPLLRAAGAELARDGVPFVDGSRVFAEERGTLYFDACHFGPEGNKILGRWIGERLLERLPP